MTALLLAEHDNRQVSKATLSVLAAAQMLGEPIEVLIAGHMCAEVATAVAHYEGVARVLYVEAPHYDVPTAENLALLLAKLAPAYSHIVTAASVRGKATIPRLAVLLDVSSVSEIVRIIDAETYERPVHAGNLISTVKSTETPHLLSIRATAFEPEERQQATPATVEATSPAEDSGLSAVKTQVFRQTDRPRLDSARIVVCGGRGFGSAEEFHRLLMPLAEKLKAAIGATRAAVDEGVPNEYQIGQSGHVIAPELYIGIGLSGAMQHTSGMKGSKVIVAINRDADTPICQLADYFMVGDLHRLVPLLTQVLDEKTGTQGNESP